MPENVVLKQRKLATKSKSSVGDMFNFSKCVNGTYDLGNNINYDKFCTHTNIIPLVILLPTVTQSSI